MLGLVVLRTKAQNGFCPMCTKGCCIVLTRSKPFWGQFWGQIGETDSYPHRSNKCAALVSFEKYEYPHHRVLPMEKPNELVYKFYSPTRSCTQTNSTPSPHTAPVWARPHCIGNGVPTASQSAPFRSTLPLPEQLHESSFIFGLCCKPSTQPDDPVRFCRAFPARVSYAHHPDLQRDHPESKTVSHRQRGHPQATGAYTT